MCGRYSIVAKAEEVASRFSVDVPPSYEAHYNAAPSQLLPVITSENPNGVSTFYWGLSPERSRNKGVSERIINLRAESILEKPVYRNALLSRRCMIPADGFYEWKKLGKKTTIPYRISKKDNMLFAFAGIWEEYEDLSGSAFHTFSILTMAPNSIVAPIHDRMPVILSRENEKVWLNPTSSEEAIMMAIQSLPNDDLEAYTVSHRVNNVKNDDAYLILPAPAADQHGNLTLFG